MPTPDSGSVAGANGSKRRRTGQYDMGASEIFEDGAEDDAEEDGGDGDEHAAFSAQTPEDENSYSKAYNPNQDPDERRRLRAKIRDHQRMVEGGLHVL
jgi:hypothetical protein